MPEPSRGRSKIPLDPENELQLVLAEFNDRRAEINNRTTAQHVLITLNITAAGAIAGVVFTTPDADRGLLLLLAPVCSALAMLWANHAATIKHIGWYIKCCLRTRFTDSEDDPVWRWELDHSTFRDEESRDSAAIAVLTFHVPVMLTFIGPAAFGLFASHDAITSHPDSFVVAGYWAVALVTIYAAAVLLSSLTKPDEECVTPT